MATKTYTGTGSIATDAAGWGGSLPLATDDCQIVGDGTSTGAGLLNDGEAFSCRSLSVDPTSLGASLTTNGNATITHTNGIFNFSTAQSYGVQVSSGTLTVNGPITVAVVTPGGFIFWGTGNIVINGDVSFSGPSQALFYSGQGGGEITVNGNMTINVAAAAQCFQPGLGTLNGNLVNTGAGDAIALQGGLFTIDGDITNSGDGNAVVIPNNFSAISTVSQSGRSITNTGSGKSINNGSGGIWITSTGDTISDANIVPGTKFAFPTTNEVLSGVSYFDGSSVGEGSSKKLSHGVFFCDTLASTV